MQNFNFYPGYYPYYTPFITQPQQQVQQPSAVPNEEISTKPKSKRGHWSAEQTDVLVNMWAENFDMI